jgi:hypothetical protein
LDVFDNFTFHTSILYYLAYFGYKWSLDSVPVLKIIENYD